MSVESTVFRATWLVAFAATTATLLAAGALIALAVGLGAGLSLFNLYWLRDGAHALVYHAARPSPVAASLAPPPRFGRTRFVARFALLAAALYAIFISHFVPFPPVLGGLLAAPAGLMAGTVIEAGRGWKRGS